jgi:hypothetical protein
MSAATNHNDAQTLALRRQIHALALQSDAIWRGFDPAFPWGRTSALCKQACGGAGVAACTHAELLQRRSWLLRWWAAAQRQLPGSTACHVVAP